MKKGPYGPFLIKTSFSDALFFYEDFFSGALFFYEDFFSGARMS
jgi:hypothetical protein